jgi:glutamyl-tRNA synthetase
MGYLPEALTNYLAKLGWGHGDEEIFSREQAVAWFDIADAGRGAARFDFKKLEHLNGHYIREADDARLAGLVADRLGGLDADQHILVARAMPVLKVRAATIVDLAEGAKFLIERAPIALDDKAKSLLDDPAIVLLGKAHDALARLSDWNMPTLENCVRVVAQEADVGLGKVAQPLRAALTGRGTSPGIFDVLLLLEREESLARIGDALRGGAGTGKDQ